MKIAYLSSGLLGYNTLKFCEKLFTPYIIATDSKSKQIITYANDNNIPLFVGNPRGGKILEFFGNLFFDAILSVNYLFIIEKDAIQKTKYPINFHGSLLPKYRGRTPHVWAIINNECKTGITAHLIDEGCDTGDIVMQRELPIGINETGADILKKFEILFPEMIADILSKIKNQNIHHYKQDNSKATYFGKRAPDDGEIDWNWQKERIRNWVRAQAYPYPGAFTRINGKIIIIDKISFSDLGYEYDFPNGLIIENKQQPIIKTPNGAIQLEIIRNEKNILKKGKILGK